MNQIIDRLDKAILPLSGSHIGNDLDVIRKDLAALLAAIDDANRARAPEWLHFSNGISLFGDHLLKHGTVELRDERGNLLARAYNVGRIDIGTLNF